MLARFAFLAVGLFVLGTTIVWGGEDVPVVEGDMGRRVHADLRAWYGNRKARNPYEGALEALRSDDAERRRWAGAYLHAFFLQSVHDEQSGLTPRRDGYALGGGPQDLGAELRWSAARELARTPLAHGGRDALAAALYLFRDDPYRTNSVPGMTVLAKIDAPEVVEVVREVVSEPHPVYEILIIGIREASKRRIEELDDEIRRLCRHYHVGVREAAREAAETMGIVDIPAAEAEGELTPGLEKGLRALAKMVFAPIPTDAKWAKVRVTEPPWQKGGEPYVYEHHGWLLGESAGGELRFLEWVGVELPLDPAKTKVLPETLPEIAAEVIRLRTTYVAKADGDLGRKLETLLGVRRFMRTVGRWTPSLPEGLMAAWSLERGDRQTVAKLLLPLLADVGHEGAVLDHFRDELAARLDHQMLDLFVTGDYADALPMARHLSLALFDGTRHQGRAKSLATQLPRRLKEDFLTLELPTEEDWREQEKSLARPERIRFLAARLRLIRAEQHGIPGGISFAEPQNRPYRRELGVKQEIVTHVNPFVELHQMDLAADEIPLLFPVLRSDDYIRAYNLPRFMPHRPWILYRARDLAATLTNTVAQRELVDGAVLESGDAGRIDEHLAEAARWCEAEGDVTLTDRLARDIVESEDWEGVKRAVWHLNGLDRDVLSRAVVKRLATDVEHRGDLLMVAGSTGDAGVGAVEAARAHLAAGTTEGRGWASLVLVEHTDREAREGIDALLEVLRTEDDPALQAHAVNPLLDTGDAKAAIALDALLEEGAQVHPSLIVVQRLFLQGHDAARDLLLDVLDGKRKDAIHESWPWSSGRYDLIGAGVDLCYALSTWTVELEPAEGEEEASRIARARAWVVETFERIRAEEDVEVERTTPAEPFVAWSGAGRWIRRL